MAKNTKKTQGAKAGSKKDPKKKPQVKLKTGKKTSPKAKKTTKKATNDYTHIIAVLDRSGSMQSVQQAAIDGFNEFLNAQKRVPGKATMTVVLFDDQYELLYDNVPLKDIQPLTAETFVPRGSTALYHSMGRSIVQYKAHLLKLTPAKTPSKVLMITITDGVDNVIGDYSQENVANMINELKNAGKWEFLFLCSTENAVLTGAKLGVAGGNVMKFANTRSGNKQLYSKVAYAATSFRGMDVNSADYSLSKASLLADAPDIDDDNN